MVPECHWLLAKEKLRSIDPGKLLLGAIFFVMDDEGGDSIVEEESSLNGSDSIPERTLAEDDGISGVVELAWLDMLLDVPHSNGPRL